ncbi:hypothetical protein PFLUV_G00038620 [Perca fluviatilis]|uniref:Uncharacterized protein n=1 Tax=Perca fluviatilis TaxID=8168 RepID=A0A6A5FKF1_PERFL|nr:hypothetical protein PFLUV_G00038620 [Perca fluviatilis]
MHHQRSLLLQLSCFSKEQSGSEAGKEQRESHDFLWHIRGFPGHLRLGSHGAGGRRHGLAAGNQAQQHRDEPDQYQSHFHRLPDLPKRLDSLDSGPQNHCLKRQSLFLGHLQQRNEICFSVIMQRSAE